MKTLEHNIRDVMSGKNDQLIVEEINNDFIEFVNKVFDRQLTEEEFSSLYESYVNYLIEQDPWYSPSRLKQFGQGVGEFARNAFLPGVASGNTSISTAQGTGTAAGAAMAKGGFFSRLVPGLGSGLSAVDAYERYKKGDKAGAAISATGVVPITPLQIMGMGLNYVRDNPGKPLEGEPTTRGPERALQRAGASPNVLQPGTDVPRSVQKPPGVQTPTPTSAPPPATPPVASPSSSFRQSEISSMKDLEKSNLRTQPAPPATAKPMPSAPGEGGTPQPVPVTPSATAPAPATAPTQTPTAPTPPRVTPKPPAEETRKKPVVTPTPRPSTGTSTGGSFSQYPDWAQDAFGRNRG